MYSYNKFLAKLNESAPKIPTEEKYWINKKKIGKIVHIYTHDDLDGIYSGIVMKNYLLSKGFKIEGYTILNYTDAWSNVTIDKSLINISLDFSEDNDDLDIYIDHHGLFTDEEKEKRKLRGSLKDETGSAYEAICRQFGIPIDSNILNVIDMVDSAKYDEYGVDITKILTFNLKDFKNKLEFAASFNQLLKRSDYTTIIEVIDNSKDLAPSIYNIFRLFKLLYPLNNFNQFKLKQFAREMKFFDNKGKPDTDKALDYLKKYDPNLLDDFRKDFVKDAEWRLSQMKKKTKNQKYKPIILNQEEFYKKFHSSNGIKLPGYQILGNMMYIPTGSWANALRGRAILEDDLENFTIPKIQLRVLKNSPIYNILLDKIGQYIEIIGDIDNIKRTIYALEDYSVSNQEGLKGNLNLINDVLLFTCNQPLFWIVLQYGNTLQIATIHNMKNYVKKYLPKSKDGLPISNLNKYTNRLFNDFIYWFGYIKDIGTGAGGHEGIGTISNIVGTCEKTTREELEENPDIKNSDINNILKIREKYDGIKFLDLFKNKIIQDLSGIPWNKIDMIWNDYDEEKENKKIIDRTLKSDEIKKID